VRATSAARVFERVSVVLDLLRHQATRDGPLLALSPQEFAVPDVLMRAEGAPNPAGCFRLGCTVSHILKLPLMINERKCIMVNPLDGSDADYLVLINVEGQHSLWPKYLDVPDGWETIFGAAKRQECLDFVEKSWSDMRPSSLVAAMDVTPSAPSASS